MGWVGGCVAHPTVPLLWHVAVTGSVCWAQGHVAGQDVTNCTSAYGAVDTVGNVEEWTMRRTPGGVCAHALGGWGVLLR